MILAASVAYGAFMFYGTVAQSPIKDIPGPATATYVIKVNSTDVWATHYDGTIDFIGSVTDARGVIQEAVDACANGGGGTVFIKTGIYNLNATLGVYVGGKVKLVGEGYENTILKTIRNDTDKYIGVALYPDYSEVRDLTVQGNGNGTGVGACWGSNGCKVLDCRITNWSVGICFGPAGTKHEFRGNIVENCNTAIYIISGSSCVVSNNIVSEIDEYGIIIRSSQDVVVAQNTIKNWGKINKWRPAVFVINENSGNSENINIIGNTVAGGNFSTEYHGIVLSGEGSSTYSTRRCTVTGNALIGVLGTDKAKCGIYLHQWYADYPPYSAPNVQDCIVSSNSIKNFNFGVACAGGKNIAIADNVAVENNYNGILLSDVWHYNVIGNLVKNNGQGSPGNSDGIYLALGCQDCLISGNICIDDQTSPTQRYGINEADQSNNNSITDNIVKGNAVCGIHKVGSNTVVKDNLGYATEKSGTATISNSKSVVVNHGLAGAPTLVVVTPRNVGYGTFAVTARDATTFTITVAIKGTYTFDWYAEYKP